MLGGIDLARAATVVSAFNGGTAEGWSLIGLPSPVSGPSWPKIGGPYPLNVSNTGGSDGGGYIFGTDSTSDALYFSAASVFLGDKKSFVNGTLSFAIRNTPGDLAASIGPNDASVILVNSLGTKALYQSVLPTTVSTTFSTLSYKLGVGGNWKVNGRSSGDIGASEQDFKDVLGDLGAAYILADYRAGNGETTAIDLVQMTSPTSSAPEPGPAVLALLALSAVAGRRRLRRPSSVLPRDAMRS